MAKRRKLTRKQKAELFFQHNGQCAECGTKLHIGDVEWDHIKERRMAVDEQDAAERESLGNFQPLCEACHLAKTANWSGIHAKARRQAGETGQRACRERAKANGTYRPILSRPDPWAKGQKIAGRGFDKKFKRTIPSKNKPSVTVRREG